MLIYEDGGINLYNFMTEIFNKIDLEQQKIFFTSLLNLDWNDLTLRGLLIPLMYRLLILGGTDEVNSLPVMVGDTKWINLKENEVRNEVIDLCSKFPIYNHLIKK